MCSVKVMPEEGKPKSQTEKREVSPLAAIWGKGLTVFIIPVLGNFYKQIGKKGRACFRV
jgi:hypothetical protein